MVYNIDGNIIVLQFQWEVLYLIYNHQLTSLDILITI